jgi:DNA (cytosine-5)-methyltransferase 1
MVAHALNAKSTGRFDGTVETMIAHTLRGEGFDASKDGTGRGTPYGVRRLTPTECARLQGFPDDWNDWIADGVRYRQFGNAICLNVARWIGKRIARILPGYLGCPHPTDQRGAVAGLGLL